MNLPKRIAFFSIGMFIGIMILLFFLGGKKASCSYFPTARTLKNIRKKDKVFSSDALLLLKKKQIDTSFLSKILQDGDVLFSESTIKQDSCNIYVISGKINSRNKSFKNVKIWIKNCTKIATVLKAEVN